MTTENTISSPRIDRKFVDERGNLTQNSYALLSGLIVRTGGVTAPVIDMDGMEGRLNSLEGTPLQPDQSAEISALFSMLETMPAPAQPTAVGDQLQDNQASSLAAELYQLRSRIEALENAP
jgi:hypothetical protein